MKFTCDSTELTNVMAVVNSTAPRISNMPALTNVRISAEKDKTIFSATDLETSVTVDLATNNLSDAGSVLVNALSLHNVISGIKQETVTIETSDKEMIVSAKNSDFALPTTSEILPPIPQFNDNNPFCKISVMDFRHAVEHTKFAIDNQSSRYAFQGICLIFAGNKIEFVATDGKRLALVTKEIGEKCDKQSVIVPPKGLIEFTKFGGDNDILLQINDNKDLIAKIDNGQFSSRLLEGQFPDFHKVIPTERSIRVVVNREQILAGLRSINSMSSTEEHFVDIEAANSKVILRIATAKGKGKYELTAVVEGGEVDLRLNIKYLMDVIQVLQKDETVLYFNADNKKPILIEEDDFIYVATPLLK